MPKVEWVVRQVAGHYPSPDKVQAILNELEQDGFQVDSVHYQPSHDECCDAVFFIIARTPSIENVVA